MWNEEQQGICVPHLKELWNYWPVTTHEGPTGIMPEGVTNAHDFRLRLGDTQALEFAEDVGVLLNRDSRADEF